jgi:hypothetical protein
MLAAHAIFDLPLVKLASTARKTEVTYYRWRQEYGGLKGD